MALAREYPGATAPVNSVCGQMPAFGACPAPLQYPARAPVWRTGGPDAPSANMPAVEPGSGLRGRFSGLTPPREATRCSLDTTAQLCHSPRQGLRNRARSKYLTEAIVGGLTGLESPLRYSYASTMRCATTLAQNGAEITGKYCRQRWCLVCSRIRTAKLIGAYLPEMARWADPYFVTLTIPNVQGPQLHNAVRAMLATMPRLARAIRRTDGLELRAIRKLEVTWSHARRDYHPHLHLIVEGRAVADALVRRWLAENPDATHKAQDVRPCTGPGAMKELFKYFTKLLAKGMDGERTAPPPRVLDTMFKAVRGLRTFQPMGFVAPKVVQADDDAMTLDATTASPDAKRERVEWEWSGALADWVDYSTGELLSGYEPPATMRALVDRIRADAKDVGKC